MKIFHQNVNYGPDFQSALIEEKALPLSPVCASLEGRTLLFLSDIHLCPRFPASAVERLLMQMEALHPDMILLGGDYAESAPWQHELFGMLGQLHPPLGMFGVPGNNDWECFPEGLEPLAEAMDRAGATLLVNRTARVDTGRGVIAIAGLNELQYSEPYDEPLFRAEDKGAFRILLAHYPQSAARYSSGPHAPKPHLALTGHTHGGQFRLFGLTPYSVFFEYRVRGMKLPFVSGWRNMNGTEMLVSPGLGTSRIPLRINSEPMIHMIRLTK